MPDTGPEVNDGAVAAVDSVSPSPNTQFPNSAVTPLVSEIASTLACLHMLWVYLQTYALEQMVQAASLSVGLRTIKRVEQTLQDLGEAEGLSYCDGSYSETPGTPSKRSYRDQDRTFVPDSFSFGGERMEKRDQRRKAPGRLSDTPSSPAQSKRPRKFKSSDG